jgi:hypothetical protein
MAQIERIAERRLRSRYPVQLEAMCETVGEGRLPFSCRALVISLSTRGAGIFSPQAFAKGSIIRLRIANRANTLSYSRLVRLVHARPTRHNWIFGCEFLSSLTDDQLGELKS